MSRRRRSPERAPRRVSWFEGAALRRVDLRDAIAHEARLLELHVSATHATWGAALGLAVAIDSARRDVIVTRGLAYTCRGEPLILARSLHIGAPPASAAPTAFDLIASMAADVEGSPCERLVACDGARVRAAMIALRWEMAGVITSPASDPPLAATVRVGEEVPLARVIRRADGTLDGPDYARRRIARAIGRPHVVSGAASALAWRDEGYRLVATVDTSDRGFTTVPRYFVSLSPSPMMGAAMIGPFAAVVASRVDSFDVSLAVAARVAGIVAPQGLRAVGDTTTLAWTGIEMARGCQPSLLGALVTSLAGGFADATPWLASLAQLGVNAP